MLRKLENIMHSIERRVAELESKVADNRLKIVVVLDGETEAEALRRAGYPADSRVVFCSEVDARL